MMRQGFPTRPISGLLVLAFGLFALGQGVEIFRPLEEGQHLPHHGHSGTVYHEPLPCDSGEHHSHLCLHSQPSTAALHYWQSFICTTVELASQAKLDGAAIVEFKLHLIRGPPLL